MWRERDSNPRTLGLESGALSTTLRRRGSRLNIYRVSLKHERRGVLYCKTVIHVKKNQTPLHCFAVNDPLTFYVLETREVATY